MLVRALCAVYDYNGSNIGDELYSYSELATKNIKALYLPTRGGPPFSRMSNSGKSKFLCLAMWFHVCCQAADISLIIRSSNFDWIMWNIFVWTDLP